MGTSGIIERSTAETDRLFRIIGEWFNGEREDLPLQGLDLGKLSPFALKVSCELRRKAPRGKTVSYGELAKSAGFAGASRAVGTVMSGNPFPLFFPCHRVVRSDGDIGFFQGGAGGISLKRLLLENEGGF